MKILKIYTGVISIIMLFGWIIYYSKYDEVVLYPLFLNVKEKRIHQQIDSFIENVNKANLHEVLLSIYGYIFSVSVLIMLVVLVFYLINLLFFNGVTLPLIKRIEICRFKRKEIWLYFASTYLPFIVFFIFGILTGEKALAPSLACFSILIIIGIFFLNLKIRDGDRQLLKGKLIIQIIITGILFVLLSYPLLKHLSFSLLLGYLIVSYMLTGVLMGIITLLQKLIQQDYQAANIAKSNLYILESIPKEFQTSKGIYFHPVNRFYKQMTQEAISKTIKSRLYKSKADRKKERGKLINDRNRTNFHVSLAIILTSVALLFSSLLFNSFELERALVILIIFLFVRLIRRAIEVIVAFYLDVTDSGMKNSDLTGGDRLKLAIISLLEISLLSASIKVGYRLFLVISQPGLSISNIVKDMILQTLEQLSIQLLNVSFDVDVGLFLGIVHFIQIITSFCLMFLAISSYIGFDRNQFEYEINYKEGKWHIKELYNSKKASIGSFNDTRSKIYFENPLNQSELKKSMSTNDYVKLINAMQEWEYWKRENNELEKLWGEHGLIHQTSRREAFKKGIEAYKEERNKV